MEEEANKAKLEEEAKANMEALDATVEKKVAVLEKCEAAMKLAGENFCDKPTAASMQAYFDTWDALLFSKNDSVEAIEAVSYADPENKEKLDLAILSTDEFSYLYNEFVAVEKAAEEILEKVPSVDVHGRRFRF